MKRLRKKSGKMKEMFKMKEIFKQNKFFKQKSLLLLLLFSLMLSACGISEANEDYINEDYADEDAAVFLGSYETEEVFSVTDIPAYSGTPYVAINDNVPQFSETDLTTTSYEFYSELDELGRCGVVYACIGQDLMPTEERGEIGQVKPTGWHTVKYEVVDGNYLYNRCHLIGFQLSGENANACNLITGTRYMNVEGMLPFENMVADYVKETGNHVMYRVTPIFEGDNLLATGVQMEAMSVEDDGEGILFNVFCYNVQPQITIDYVSGESIYEGEAEDSESTDMVWKTETGKKYHRINDCGNMNPAKAIRLTEAEAQVLGLGKCGNCW